VSGGSGKENCSSLSFSTSYCSIVRMCQASCVQIPKRIYIYVVRACAFTNSNSRERGNDDFLPHFFRTCLSVENRHSSYICSKGEFTPWQKTEKQQPIREFALISKKIKSRNAKMRSLGTICLMLKL